MEIQCLHCHVASEKNGAEDSIFTATLRLRVDGEVKTEAFCGKGPYQAIFGAFCRITGMKVSFLPVIEVTEGIAVAMHKSAQAYIRVDLGRKAKHEFASSGSAVDGLTAFLLALVVLAKKIP